MKSLTRFFAAALFCVAGTAQASEFIIVKLMELTQSSDTPKVVYANLMETTGASKAYEIENQNGREYRATSESVSEGAIEKPAEKIDSVDANNNSQNNISGDEIVFGKTTVTPYERPVQEVSVGVASKGDPSFLDTHALALASNCEPLVAESRSAAAVVSLGDEIFVIPSEVGDLPPYPAGGGIEGLHGVDINKNCVRDDIEHYVFKKYAAEDQKKLRLNLYAHAIWLNFLLIDEVSDKTAQAIARQIIKTGKCLDSTLGEAEGALARGDLFAHVHNTVQRTEAYFDSQEVLSEDIIISDVTGPCL